LRNNRCDTTKTTGLNLSAVRVYNIIHYGGLYCYYTTFDDIIYNIIYFYQLLHRVYGVYTYIIPNDNNSHWQTRRLSFHIRIHILRVYLYTLYYTIQIISNAIITGQKRGALAAAVLSRSDIFPTRWLYIIIHRYTHKRSPHRRRRVSYIDHIRY
jgi:hypothetical protein